MARTKSVILSPAEKKTLAADLKTKIKALNDAGKSAASELKTALKAHNEVVKAHEKASKTREKELAALKGQLENLSTANLPQ